MDEDKFALVEKIVKDINNIISKNAELSSFDIVPVEANFQNKSPVLHLENCLGLESWCVKHVYMYCYNEVMDNYFTKPKHKTLKLSSIVSDRLARLLNVTLLLNPELTSLWNKRREMTRKLLLEKSAELQFSKLVLSRKPKCNDAFSYRRWLLDIILLDAALQSNYLEHLVNEELNICETTADKSPNNYHSWNHRMWLLDKLKTSELPYDLNFLFIKEYDFSERWSSKHVSDFSCFHYRQFCIKNIFTITNEKWKAFETTINIDMRKIFVHVLSMNYPNDVSVQVAEEDLLSYSEDNLINLLLCYTVKNCDCIVDNMLICRKLEILFRELVLNNELLTFYKSHETLWYHRRFIIHEIIVIMFDHFGLVRQNGVLVKSLCIKCNKHDLRQKQAKIGRYDSNKVYSSILFNVVMCYEKKFIHDRRSDGDNYADRHEKYLKFIETLNNVM